MFCKLCVLDLVGEFRVFTFDILLKILKVNFIMID
jgi:hypothetical protein